METPEQYVKTVLVSEAALQTRSQEKFFYNHAENL